MWVGVVVFVVVYALIASEKVDRVVAALTGARVVLAVGVLAPEDTFFSEETGSTGTSSSC